jgi:preprotein translocase subunit SecD
MVPKEDQTLALGSREQIKFYASQAAQRDLQNLVTAARAGEAVPDRLSFLVSEAKKIRKSAKQESPQKWDAAAVVSTFTSRNEILDTIESYYRNTIFKLKDLQKKAVQLGLDLSGGLSIVLQSNTDSLKERLGRDLDEVDREDAINAALEVLNNRIDQFGLTEPVIRRQGTDQIYVEIPGTADPERINSIIMGKGGLAFHIVDREATTQFLEYYNAHPTSTFDSNGNLIDPTIIPTDVVVRGVYTKDRYGLDEFTGSYTVIKREVGLDGNHIKSALVERNTLDGKPEVTFLLDSEGGEIFYKLTSANVGKPLAIVLDDRVKSQATIQTAIRDAVRLTGFGLEEAQNIALP